MITYRLLDRIESIFILSYITTSTATKESIARPQWSIR